MKHSKVTVLAIISLLILSGCSLFSLDQDNTMASSGHINSPTDLAETAYAKQGRDENINIQNSENLWVWIAPSYRQQQPDMHSEYIIVPVQ